MPAVLRSLACFLLAALVFALAYTQAPLYYSNQNQYFLHGLADGGKGNLDRDWLASTADPTPVFSALVAFTYRFLDERLFHVYYALLMGIYFVSLLGLFAVLAGERASFTLRCTFAALLLLLHSALLRYGSVQLLGNDYPWYFQAGVAGQYMLGDMLQPSAFGVLLLAAMYLFVVDKPVLAVTCSSLAAAIHSTYLLGAAALTVAFLCVLLSRRQVRKALLVGSWALLLVLPTLLYNWLHFVPTEATAFAEAANILVHVRLPHHAQPLLWADTIAWLQIGWLILGIALAYGTRLFPLLLVPFLFAAALTVLQIATDSQPLALLFPWRISIYLLPVATAVILTRGLLLLAPKLERHKKLLLGLSGAIVLLAVGGGVWIMADRLGYQTGDEELAMMAHVRDQRSEDDLYLLPVALPSLARTTRGSRASSFIPLSRKRGDTRLIPVDLQRFRLFTGVPIYVDFKSIPYRDVDVLEWYRRMQTAQELYQDMQREPCASWLPRLRAQHITHIVTPARQLLECPELEEVYADDYYRIYALKKL